ncbi:MAG: DUF1501 domain-containing protein [Planctomycetes bacterium]|nr:DUF1501 domain-containing protein [Planctomycetota bacterium]
MHAPASDWCRRQVLRGLGFGALGVGLPQVLAAPVTAPRRAKACVMLWLFGGPSQIDTFDLKPDAPDEFRGEFKPIATAAPGIRICEHLPKTARLAKHLVLVRSVTMSGRVIGNGDHHADTYYVLTGHRPDRSFFVEGINRKPRADDWPFVGSAVAALRPGDPALPGVVQLPTRSGEATGYINPGQFAGLLGPTFEPVMVRGVLEKPRELTVPDFETAADLGAERLGARGTLLTSLDRWQRAAESPGGALDAHDTHRRKALALLTSRAAKRAFDITREPARVRDRYGDDINCQSVLMARRLVEAGVPFVCVHWIAKQVGPAFIWDTHGDNFAQLKNNLLPKFDACYSTLLDDLDDRGLLDETLVVVCAEMGRTPRIGDPRTGGKGPPGRDHWVHCQTALFAGGGIRGGQVYGASDKVAAYPAEKPVHPEDLAATIYRAFGIPNEHALRTRDNRPLPLLDEGNALPLFE